MLKKASKRVGAGRAARRVGRPKSLVPRRQVSLRLPPEHLAEARRICGMIRSVPGAVLVENPTSSSVLITAITVGLPLVAEGVREFYRRKRAEKAKGESA